MAFQRVGMSLGMFLVLSIASTPTLFQGVAGELDCDTRNCDFSTSVFDGPKWKPKTCSEPPKPSFIILDVENYNKAVREFNSYLSDVQSYIACITEEGNTDIKTFVGMVQNGVNDTSSEMRRKVDNVRVNLEMKRP